MKIEGIFKPVHDNWDVIYIKFHSETSVNTPFRYARNIRKNDHKLVKYIPTQMVRLMVRLVDGKVG